VCFMPWSNTSSLCRSYVISASLSAGSVSYCPSTRGCLHPRTHLLPLLPSVQPSPQCAALESLTPPGGLTWRTGGPNAPHLQTTACTQKQTPSSGPACCLAQLCRRQGCSAAWRSASAGHGEGPSAVRWTWRSENWRLMVSCILACKCLPPPPRLIAL